MLDFNIFSFPKLKNQPISDILKIIYHSNRNQSNAFKLGNLAIALSSFKDGPSISNTFESMYKGLELFSAAKIAPIFFSLNSPAINLMVEMLKASEKYGSLNEEINDLENLRDDLINAKENLVKNYKINPSAMAHGPISFAILHLSGLSLENKHNKMLMASLISNVEDLVVVADNVLWFTVNIHQRVNSLVNQVNTLKANDRNTSDGLISSQLSNKIKDLDIMFKLNRWVQGQNDLLKLRNDWSKWLDDSSVERDYYHKNQYSNLTKVKGRNPFV